MAKKRNAIDKLIAELCPEGVEWKSLGDVARYRRGSFPQPYGRAEWYDGIEAMPFVQVFDVGKNMQLVKNTKKRISKLAQPKSVFVPARTVIVTLQGSIGRVAITQYDSYVDRTLAIFESFKIEINKKYFAYQLQKKFGIEKENARGSTIKTITKEELTKFSIPIPPLAIQQEIVKILDTFTALEAELAAELEAELKARKQQYEYYQDELLTFGEDVEWKTLGEIGEFVRGSGLPKSDFTESGVGCIHYGQIYTYYGAFTDRTKSFVSPETAKKLQKVHTNDLIITNTSENIEDVCKTVAWLGSDEIVTGGHASIFKHNENPKYLSYYTQTQMFCNEKRKLAKGIKVIDVSAKDLAKIKIPIPPLTEQERIVAILDKFDALVNDISVGLPAELNARRKQYEYYRNKLLTFKPLEENHAKQ